MLVRNLREPILEASHCRLAPPLLLNCEVRENQIVVRDRLHGAEELIPIRVKALNDASERLVAAVEVVVHLLDPDVVAKEEKSAGRDVAFVATLLENLDADAALA